jgi:hypothetical protein
MTHATEELLNAALTLPTDERLELIDALLAVNDESEDLPFDRSWLPEIGRRGAEIDANSVALTPWRVMRGELQQRLDERSGG